MAEFKNKEDYEKWKIEKQKARQQTPPAAPAPKADTKLHRNNHSQGKSSKKKGLIFLGIGLLIVLPAVYFSWHYMTHGKLSGNVYVTMKSGDVKKAAGIEVMLISVPNPEQTLKEIEKGKIDSDLAIIAVYQSMASLKEDADYSYKMKQDYEEMANRYTYSKDSLNETASKYRAEFLEKSKKLDPYWEKMKALRTDHNKKVADRLSSGKNITVQTDVNGVYEFQGLKRGKYLLLARHTVFDNKINWFLVAELKDRENKLDLTTNNSTSEIVYDMSKE